MEFYRVWLDTDTYVWIGVAEGVVFLSRNDERLILICGRLGYGIPVDMNIKDFSREEFLNFAKSHPLFCQVEDWEQVGIPKPGS